MAIEEPKYEIKTVFGDVEIRQYDSVIVAETEVEGDFGEAGNIGFRRIAGYIFGGNHQKQKIEMTAPVLQENSPKGEKIDMTAPVLQREKLGKKIIAFVMPSDKTMENLPVPNDSHVILRSVPARKMAVLKYSGTWSEERYQEKLKELQTLLSEKNIKAKGEPLLARYNPPWIPWFLRRNEVLIEVE